MTRSGISDISRMNAEEQFTDLTISSFLKLSIISFIFHGHGQSGILQTPSNV